METASQIRKWAENLTGREQLAAQDFAEALETIPITLAVNAGMSPIDAMTEMRAKHAGVGKWIGVDTKEGKVKDMYKENVLEPLSVKEQIIKSATEAACMILRIDDVIAAGKSRGPGGPPPGAGGTGGGEFD
jgi:chaperonin GroEL (HSP60 family)